MKIEKHKRPAYFSDDSEEGRAKRRLITSMAGLSLKNGKEYEQTNSTVNKSYSQPYEYIDIGRPDTVFIPSIDEYLREDKEEQQQSQQAVSKNILLGNSEPDGDTLDGFLFRKSFHVPDSILRSSRIKLHFYERPTLDLIPYVPMSVIILRHLYRPLTKQAANIGDMEMIMDVENGRDVDSDDIDMDIDMDMDMDMNQDMDMDIDQ